MLKALKFILIAAVFLVFAWWIAGLPGNVTAHTGPYTIETSTPAALLVLFLIAVLLTIMLRVIGGVRATPGGISAWRGGRRARLGETATQRGLVALAAGDAPAAREQAARARKLVGETPLVLLLAAESARLANQPDEARAAFAQLTQHKEMAFLGHRGLLRHAMESADPDTAHAHALRAQDSYPGSVWLKSTRLQLAVQKQDWRAALALTQQPPEIAALATQAARTAPDHRAAIAYAKRAIRVAPSLAPAVSAYADALRAAGKPRAANRALVLGWKAAPHPMLAASYLAPLSTPIERAQAAGNLASANPAHVESELVLAETALAARLSGEARRHAEGALAAGAKDGRAEAVLAALDGKPPTALAMNRWTCSACQTTHPDWSPTCPNCARIGTLGWR